MSLVLHVQNDMLTLIFLWLNSFIMRCYVIYLLYKIQNQFVLSPLFYHQTFIIVPCLVLLAIYSSAHHFYHAAKMSLTILLRFTLITMSHEIINRFMKFTNKRLKNRNEKMQHADFLLKKGQVNLIDLCCPILCGHTICLVYVRDLTIWGL